MARYVVCDYCGHVKSSGKSCEVCTTKSTSLPEEQKFCAMENCHERISVKQGNLFCDLHPNSQSKKCSHCDIMVYGKKICDRCSKQKPSTVVKTNHSSDNLGYGRASCRICGNTFETYPATKAAQKAAGNALAWGGIGLTMLTGGLSAFVFGLMPGVAGGSLAGSAEVYTLCPKCR
ncbi:hypothetical protein N9K54_00600 [Candidatus Poseidonia alphae]|nr:hypothetical protein [Candidatus Poseidonia alphae]